jgi:hypothetical protein
MAGYTKLFSTIVTSTIWQEDSDTRVIWITLLALTDAKGFVDATIPGIAGITKIPLATVEAAMTKFTLPDVYSRSQDHEGRRIMKVDGGWVLLNYAKYREKMRSRADYFKDYRKRAKAVFATKTQQSQPKDVLRATISQQTQPIAEAEANKAFQVAQPVVEIATLEQRKEIAKEGGITKPKAPSIR